MMSYRNSLLASMVAVALVAGAAGCFAQSGGKPPTPPVAEAPANGEVETLKERLSDKASDEQRVDNCKVPLDRRGAKPRPEGCRSDEASATPPKLP
ncbi:MAG TPA: hypothetical protein VHT04_16950 [Stellaceae bacterium]|jgi:hypothetical protein|nr:hypothetical protein [Stellaceae bacterium]